MTPSPPLSVSPSVCFCALQVLPPPISLHIWILGKWPVFSGPRTAIFLYPYLLDLPFPFWGRAHVACLLKASHSHSNTSPDPPLVSGLSFKAAHSNRPLSKPVGFSPFWGRARVACLLKASHSHFNYPVLLSQSPSLLRWVGSVSGSGLSGS